MKVMIAVLAVAAFAFAAQSQQPIPQAQQRPVFRGGTHFVRVDAYPAENGHIVEGLKPDDFEILEDGKRQAIDSFDFITFDAFTPDAERRDPVSPRAGFDMAADPRYRLFVVYVDMALSISADTNEPLPRIQQPLVEFFNRIVGPQDLFGFLTSRNSVKDLVLGQKTSVTVDQVMDLWRAKNIDRDDADDALGSCSCGQAENDLRVCRALINALKIRYRADASYTNLMDVVGQLGSLRQERKNLVLVTNLLPRWRPDQTLLTTRGAQSPRSGIVNGRITNDNREVVTNAGGNANACASQFERLALMDFEPRYYELVQEARRQNVAFYVITPGGLQAPVNYAAIQAVKAAYNDLTSLAEDTGGLAVTDTNDLNAGFRRIADDLAAYYVLGYYTTNTTFDGGLRKISVKVKGKSIRARREYRAPTEAEIAALARSAAPASASPTAASKSAVSPREAALTILERANRPFVPYVATAGKALTVVAELSAASIQAGRWKDGADVEVRAIAGEETVIASARGRIESGSYAVAVPLTVAAGAASRVSITLRGSGEPPASDWIKLEPVPASLIGEPIAYRTGPRSAPRPVAAFEFARNERLRAEWPVLAPLERRDVRLLDRNGKPIPVDLPLSESADQKTIVVEMSLSGLPRGDYLIELTAGAGSTVERRLLAIRMKP